MCLSKTMCVKVSARAGFRSMPPCSTLETPPLCASLSVVKTFSSLAGIVCCVHKIRVPGLSRLFLMTVHVESFFAAVRISSGLRGGYLRHVLLTAVARFKTTGYNTLRVKCQN